MEIQPLLWEKEETVPFGTGYLWGDYKQQLCLPTTLPSYKLLEMKEIDKLQDMGFIFGDFVDGSDEFVQYSTFPRGWSKMLYEQNDDRKLWSLVDSADYERARAFGWDYFGFSSLSRFCFREDQGQAFDAVMIHIIDRVTSNSVFTSQIYSYTPRADHVVEDVDKYGVVTITPYGVALGSAYDEARVWMASRYPEYKNPCSYWD